MGMLRSPSSKGTTFGCLVAMSCLYTSPAGAQQADAARDEDRARSRHAATFNSTGGVSRTGRLPPGLDVSPTTRWRSGAHASESMGAYSESRSN